VLVTSGPYCLTRNPAYLGWGSVYAGIALVGGSAIRREEGSFDVHSVRPTTGTELASGVASEGPERPKKAMNLTRLAAAPGTPTQGAAAWPRWRRTAAITSQLVAPRAGHRGHRRAAYRRCSADAGVGHIA
jgi:hypothetical protein